MVIHLTLSDVGRKTASRSFVAFERSIVADSSGYKSKFPVLTWMSSRRTRGITSDVERPEGVRAPLRKCRYRRNIFLGVLRQHELLEVDTARYGQQSTSSRSQPRHHEREGPNKRGWVQRLDDGWQSTSKSNHPLPNLQP